MAAQTEINFTELIDLSLGTPEVVNYKGLRVLLAAIVSQLGVSAVNLQLNEHDKKELDAVKETQANEKNKTETLPTRPATGTQGAKKENALNADIADTSKSITLTNGRLSPEKDDGSMPKVLHDMEAKVSKIEEQLSILNALPSNESLIQRSRSGSSNEEGKKVTPVTDMWQLMQCQRKASANEEGVSKLMSMVGDLMAELQGIQDKLASHSSDISDLQNKHSDLLNKHTDLQNKHTDLQKDIEKINDNNKTVETRLDRLETSAGQQDKIDELQKLLDSMGNQLAGFPSLEQLVTWPDFEAALKGAYQEPVDQLDSGMQTAPMVDHTRMQTMPLTDASAQTSKTRKETPAEHDGSPKISTPVPPTPSPPSSRPVSSKSLRSGIFTSSVHPSQEIQRILRQLGELTGRHDLLEDRVKGLEELLAKKADRSEVEALLAQSSIPGDLAKKLAELEEGLNHLRDSKSKLEDIEKRLREQSQHCPASLADLMALRQEMEQAIADLIEAQDALARDLSHIGTATTAGDGGGAVPAVDPTLLRELESRLESKLQQLSGSVQQHLKQMDSVEQSLRDRLRVLGVRVEELARVRSHAHIARESGETVVVQSLDSQELADLQNTLLQLQAEVDKLNASYVHLVDEHNVKQKHIDALYTFVDRLQENKADKEHVIMEIDVKADKRSLENKVSRSQFDGTVDELSKNLNDVMEKMAGHRVAWDSAVGELKLDIDNKLDRMELDPLKSYLDNRIKSVSNKMVRKEVETGEDAAGFRRPLQKFNCISCDRPLDMTSHTPIPSLPENKGLPGSRSGRPYTTFELEQIRAAQKNMRPGKNIQHYELALFSQELARRRKQEIMSYLVRVDRGLGGLEPRLKPVTIPPIGNMQQMHSYGYKLEDGGNFQDVPDYFVASRSCGGSHTMTYPHRRITRVAQMTNMVTTEEIAPVVNGRVEADIEGQDGHIYKARIGQPHMTERLPTLAQPKTGRMNSPRVSSARGRRSQPPTRQSVEPAENTNNHNIGLVSGRPHAAGTRPTSARGGPNRPTSARPSGNARSPGADSPGRGSPVAAPPNEMAVNGGGGGGQPPPALTPRNTKTETIMVPQPPQDQDHT